MQSTSQYVQHMQYMQYKQFVLCRQNMQYMQYKQCIQYVHYLQHLHVKQRQACCISHFAHNAYPWSGCNETAVFQKISSRATTSAINVAHAS